MGSQHIESQVTPPGANPSGSLETSKQCSNCPSTFFSPAMKASNNPSPEETWWWKRRALWKPSPEIGGLNQLAV